MISRIAIPVLIVYLCLSPLGLAQQTPPEMLPPALPSSVAHAQDFERTVLPITELKFIGLGVEAKFATGFCLDPECRFIGTNYHAAMMAKPRKIKGEKVVKRYLATGPEDEGATVNEVRSTAPMKFTLTRDLAIFELRRSLRDRHGIGFYLNDLQAGQKVEIYAYPTTGINPFRNLQQYDGAFKGKTTSGLLAFDYRLAGNKSIRPGASGGIVVDAKTQQIVGILQGIARDGESIALAVPVSSLVDFVGKAQPFLAQRIFPSTLAISPVPADLYPKFAPARTYGLRFRSEDPPEVKLLRNKAQLLADDMRNFIAVQTFAWGTGNHEPAAMSAYEVRVLNGHQRFREYPDGHKELKNVPFPPLGDSLVPGGEWSELPQMVGTELQLKIYQAPDVVVNQRRIKVFQYQASIEDGVCDFKASYDFGFFEFNRVFVVACYGEVWTDEDNNLLRISQHLEMSGKWHDYEVVVTYGWLHRIDDSPRLVPLTIAAQVGDNKKVYWCRGLFTDYKVFTTDVKMVAKKK